MCLLFHSQRQKMEDDSQDLGGEGNHEHGDKAIVIKNTQKPGPRNQAMPKAFQIPRNLCFLFLWNKGQYRYG